MKKIFLLLAALFTVSKYDAFDRDKFVEIERFIFADSKYFPDAVQKDSATKKADIKELTSKFDIFKKELYKKALIYDEKSEGIYQNYKVPDGAKASTAFTGLLDTFKTYFSEHYISPDDTYKVVYEDQSALDTKVDSISIRPAETEMKSLWERVTKVLFLLLKESKFDSSMKSTGTPDSTKSTFIKLKNNLYSTPSVRFREQYYWDSYFQMVGFLAIGEISEAKNMLDNFMDQIEMFGFIPNANRTYYLNRSQPPLFGLMVKAFLNHTGLGSGYDEEYLTKLLASLEKELKYWTLDGKHRVTVTIGDKSYDLFRYFTDEDKPRLEGFKEDLKVCIAYLTEVDTSLSATDKENLCLNKVDEKRYSVKSSPKVVAHIAAIKLIYSQIAASCESGFDFSTKHFPNNYGESELNQDLNSKLAKLVTHSIAPVELQVYVIILREAQLLVASKLNGINDIKYGQDLIGRLTNEKNANISDFVKVFYDPSSKLYFDRFWEDDGHGNLNGDKGRGTRIYGVNQIVPTLIEWEEYKATKEDAMDAADIDHKTNLEGFHKTYDLQGSKWLVKTSHYNSKLNWDNNFWPPIIYFHFKALIKHGLKDDALKVKNSYIFNFVNISNFINVKRNKSGDVDGDANAVNYMIEKIMGTETPLDFMSAGNNRIYNDDFQKGYTSYDLDENTAVGTEGEYERQFIGGFGWTVGTIVSMLTENLVEITSSSSSSSSSSRTNSSSSSISTSSSSISTKETSSGNTWKVILIVGAIVLVVIGAAVVVYIKKSQSSKRNMHRRRQKEV